MIADRNKCSLKEVSCHYFRLNKAENSYFNRFAFLFLITDFNLNVFLFLDFINFSMPYSL